MTEIELSSFDSVSVNGVAERISIEVDPQIRNSPVTKVSWNIPSGEVKGVTEIAPSPKNATPTLGGAGFAAFLRLDPNIAGMSSAEGYQNWIEIEDFDFSLEADTTFATGVSVGRPEPGTLNWSQALDNTLPASLTKILTGSSLSETVIELVKDIDGAAVTYAQFVFKDGLFTNISLAGQTVSESVAFRELTQTIFSFDESGRRTGGTTFTWDASTGKASFGGARPAATRVPGFGDGLLIGGTAGTLPRETPPPPTTVPLPA
ncbi:MAG: type VI secretion system tube protein Hcp, partial [Proteobacteria bacterium]|nr:type VI secretion system tube protein Hcp [Pseudomonadota bacterium]